MADATRFQVKSKQIDEHKQATDASATQMEKLTQSQAQIDKLVQSQQKMVAMMAALMSQSSGLLGRPPDPQYSASGDLTSYPQAPQPPDPPDFNRLRQNPTIKDASRAPDYNLNLTSKTSTNKTLRLRYSCEEIYERMENGFCIFCEDLDTPGHYNLKHKGSKLCLVESVGGESPDDEKPGEAIVEEIANKPVDMIQDKESNPENESRPEVSHQVPLSQSKVAFSSLEHSHRCHNHYASLDVSDKDMGDEPVCDKDGDSIVTMSAKFCETYEEPQFELMCLKQSHDSVENYLGSLEYALTRSSLQQTPSYQYRAPFNPYQKRNDQCHYKREFGNYTGLEIEFDRASEEVEDDELQDKQPEDENFGVDKSVDMIREDISTPENESSLEVTPQILFSQLKLFDDESQGTLEDHTLTPIKPYQSYAQPCLKCEAIPLAIENQDWIVNAWFEIQCRAVQEMVLMQANETVTKTDSRQAHEFQGTIVPNLAPDFVMQLHQIGSSIFQEVQEELWLALPISTANQKKGVHRESSYAFSGGGIKEVSLVCSGKSLFFFVVYVVSADDQTIALEKESFLPPKIIREFESKIIAGMSRGQNIHHHHGKDYENEELYLLGIEVKRAHMLLLLKEIVNARFEIMDCYKLDVLMNGLRYLMKRMELHLPQGHNKAATKALVQWKEHPPDQATWEFYQDPVAKYPDFPDFQP